MTVIKTIVDELAIVGPPLSEEEMVINILKGLGFEFRQLSETIRARDSSILFEELHGKLADHEMFLKREEFKKESVSITAQLNQKCLSNFGKKGNNSNTKKGQNSTLEMIIKATIITETRINKEIYFLITIRALSIQSYSKPSCLSTV